MNRRASGSFYVAEKQSKFTQGLNPHNVSAIDLSECCGCNKHNQFTTNGTSTSCSFHEVSFIQPLKHPGNLPTTKELAIENELLRQQNQEYLRMLKKNEDMLYKAKELIQKLRRDETNACETSVALLRDFCNTNGFKGFQQHQQQELLNANEELREAKDQLARANKEISRQKEYIRRLEETFNEQRSLIVHQKKLAEFDKENNAGNQHQQQTLDDKKKILELQHMVKELSKRLSEALKSNKLLRRQSQEGLCDFSVLKEAESKLDNLEMNLSRIEEASGITHLPTLEKKVQELSQDYETNLQVVRKAADYLRVEVSTLYTKLSKSPAFPTKPFSLIDTISSRKDGFLERLISRTKNPDIVTIINSLNIVTLIEKAFEAFSMVLIQTCEQRMKKAVFGKMNELENKFSSLENMVGKMRVTGDLPTDITRKAELNHGGHHNHLHGNKEQNLSRILCDITNIEFEQDPFTHRRDMKTLPSQQPSLMKNNTSDFGYHFAISLATNIKHLVDSLDDGMKKINDNVWFMEEIQSKTAKIILRVVQKMDFAENKEVLGMYEEIQDLLNNNIQVAKTIENLHLTLNEDLKNMKDALTTQQNRHEKQERYNTPLF